MGVATEAAMQARWLRRFAVRGVTAAVIAVALLEVAWSLGFRLSAEPVYLLAALYSTLRSGVGDGLITTAATYMHAIAYYVVGADVSRHPGTSPLSLAFLAIGGPLVVAAAGLFGRRQPSDDETTPAWRRSERTETESSEPVRWERDSETFRFVEVSPNAEDLLGYPVGDWVGDPTLWVPGTDPEDRERARSAYDAVRADLQDREVEYRVVTSDGRFIWMREKINVIRDATGKPTSFRGEISAIPGPGEARERGVSRRREPATVVAETGALRDTTAREVARGTTSEVTRETTRDVSREAGAAKPTPPSRETVRSSDAAPTRDTTLRRETSSGRDVAPSAESPAVSGTVTRRRAAEPPPSAGQDTDAVALAQALRDPLTSILGWARLLRSGTLDEPTRARALDTIERSAEGHVRVLDDILDLATISRGDLQLQIRPVDLALTVQATVEAARPTAAAKNVALRSSIDPALGSVPGDAERLGRIVSTLITNAVKSTPKGGRVDVRLEDAGEDLRLTVSDTGRGIRPDALARLFERDATTALRGSYGLGLAIARQLVELHGGTLRAESAGEGQGATFTVTLPLSRPAERGQVGEAA